MMLQLDFSLSEAEWLTSINAEITWQKEIVDFVELWCSSATSFAMHTSGSTGTPKVVEHLRNELIQSALRTNHFFKLNHTSVFFLCLPVQHIGGRMMLIRAIVAKAKIVCVAPASNPLSVAIFSLPITFSAFTPMQCFDMLQHQQSATLFSSIPHVIIGGGKISDALLTLLNDMPNAIYETFGMTETISHIALRSIAPFKENYFQCLEGISVATNEDSLLQIKIENQAPISTNDVVEIIDSTRFRWLGRQDEVINTGGIKVFAHQIESKLQSQFSVPFFITAMNDDKFGQRVVLVLQSQEVAESLTKSSFETLSNYERPKSIFVLKQFEYSALGKLLKKSSIEHYFLTRIDV
jgi:O-succinylbenzoic acid--CoA ligase